MTRYRKVFQAFNDLVAGLDRARSFYGEMQDTADSLKRNVDGFVDSRRSEGAQLLQAIEGKKNGTQQRAGSGSNAGLVDWERERLQQLMDRMSVESPVNTHSPQRQPAARPPIPSYASGSSGTHQSPQLATQYATQAQAPGGFGGMQSPPPNTGYLPRGQNGVGGRHESYSSGQSGGAGNYNPNNYGPVSPPPQQQYHQQHQMQQQPSSRQSHGHYFSPPPVPGGQANQGPYTPGFGVATQQQPQQQSHPAYGSQGQGVGRHGSVTQQHMPPGWQPPPPPPGPPPSQDFSALTGGSYPSGPGGYAQGGRQPQGQQSGQDPWGGLSGWK